MKDVEDYWTEHIVINKKEKERCSNRVEEIFRFLYRLENDSDGEEKENIGFVADALEFALKRKFRGLFENKEEVEKIRSKAENK